MKSKGARETGTPTLISYVMSFIAFGLMLALVQSITFTVKVEVAVADTSAVATTWT